MKYIPYSYIFRFICTKSLIFVFQSFLKLVTLVALLFQHHITHLYLTTIQKRLKAFHWRHVFELIVWDFASAYISHVLYMVHTGGARDLTYYILLIFGYLSNAPIHLWIYQMDWNSQSQWSKELGLRGPGLIKRCVGPSLFLALQRIPYLAVSSKLNFVITQYQDFYLFISWKSLPH